MRMTEDEYSKLMQGRNLCYTYSLSMRQPIPTQPQPEKTPQKSNLKQTKVEMEYGRMLALEFPGVQIIPWGLTLRMGNGHKYTPDFAVLADKILLVEVKQRGKNGFRQHSYQRAKLAYDQCRSEFKQFDYRWAEKHNREWTWG